jgi:PAS domain S-box-containing protein
LWQRINFFNFFFDDDMCTPGFLRSDRSPTIGYGVAVLSVGGVFFLLNLVKPQFASAFSSLFLCAVMLTAWFGDTKACFLSVLLSILVYDFYFSMPLHSYVITSDYNFYLFFFAMAVVIIGGLAAAQKFAVRAANAASEELALAIEELKKANQQLAAENVERERIHEELRYSEAFLAEGQKISKTGSWRWNMNAGTLFWSDELYRIFGYDPSSTLSCFDMYRARAHPVDDLYLVNTAKAAVCRRERFECEYRVVLPGNNIRYLRGIGCPTFSKDGNFEDYIGVVVDITSQRQAEDALRKSEQEFRTLAENSPDGVIRYDRDCRRIYVNPAHLKNLGVHHDEAVNVALDTHWGGDMPVEAYRDILRGVIKSGIPAQVDGRWVRPDGKIIFYAVHAVAERGSDGEVASVLAISRNITAIKDTEHRLKESQTLLRHLADRSEIRIEEERKHIARELHDELAQHLSALRMNVAVMKLEFGPLLPGLIIKADRMIERLDETIRIVRNVIASLRPTALDMGIILALEWLANGFSMENDIPCRLHVKNGDIVLNDRLATAIFRIAQESLCNIARHAEATAVDVIFWSVENACYLSIRDDGKGFDPSVTSTDCFGLSGIRERALILGGEMNIDSAQAQGTTIRVRIPMTE